MNEAISKLSIEAKIKLKYKEWEVEITCTEDKVKQVVENVLLWNRYCLTIKYKCKR